MAATALLVAAAATGLLLAQTNDTSQGEDFARRTDFSCQNWNAQERGGDRQLMARLAGVWEADTVIPATPGVVGETPQHVVVRQWASGDIVIDMSACFAPYGFQPSCAKSMRRGRWFAYPAGQDGSFLYATALVGSSYTGAPLPPNCGGTYARFQDDNTTIDQYGSIAHRTGTAP